MVLQIHVPALIFPVVSLLFIAFTSRFLGLSSVIRNLVDRYRTDSSPGTAAQLGNLMHRIRIIRAAQLAGLISIILASASTVALFFECTAAGAVLFVVAVISLIVSLALCVRETFLSVGALEIECQRVGVEV
jgi:hypothetical protein